MLPNTLFWENIKSQENKIYEQIDSSFDELYKILSINLNDKSFVSSLKDHIKIMILNELIVFWWKNTVWLNLWESSNIKNILDKNTYLHNITVISFLWPIFEEFLFRFIPNSIFWDSSKEKVLSSGIFALLHSNIFKKEVPLMQFIWWMWFYSLTQKKWIEHAILAHIENNLLSILKNKI